MQIRRWCSWPFVMGVAFLFAGLPGCSGAPARPPLTKVAGKVTFKGQPIVQGSITFFPEKGRSAQGKIVSGEIKDVTTFDAGDGAPIGPVKVTVAAFDKPETDMHNPPKSIIPEKYGSLATTDLTAKLEAGKSNEVSFDLKE